MRKFLSTLPAAWDETRFISGYPGESIVMARRSGSKWYIAGINGTDEKKALLLSLPSTIKLPPSTFHAFYDSSSKSQPWDIRTKVSTALPAKVTCQPRGGFVIVIEP